MTGAGRPLRFLLVVMGGWTGARLWCLWPAVPDAVRPATPPARTAAATPIAALAWSPPVAMMPSLAPAAPAPRAAAPPDQTPSAPGSGDGKAPSRASDAARGSGSGVDGGVPAVGSTLRFADPAPIPAPVPARPSAVGAARAGSRLSGSAWLLARGGPALAGGLAAAQLGGSQAGVRLAFAIDRARRLAVVGRLSAAIGGADTPHVLSDREGAVGLAWRPTRLPVTLVAEQRFVFEHGGHGGPVLGVIAGLPPTPVAAGFRLDAYGQAGAIARAGAGNGVEGFGDGAARLAHPVTLGTIRLDVGAGMWGGAQRGAARLDVGPTLGAAVPVAGHAIRIAADWRQRIAGAARPGSGPALSLGIDF